MAKSLLLSKCQYPSALSAGMHGDHLHLESRGKCGFFPIIYQGLWVSRITQLYRLPDPLTPEPSSGRSESCGEPQPTLSTPLFVYREAASVGNDFQCLQPRKGIAVPDIQKGQYRIWPQWAKAWKISLPFDLLILLLETYTKRIILDTEKCKIFITEFKEIINIQTKPSTM